MPAFLETPFFTIDTANIDKIRGKTKNLGKFCPNYLSEIVRNTDFFVRHLISDFEMSET